MIPAGKIPFFICFFIASLSSQAFSFEGPLQINNLYPLFLHANQPYLEKAAPENSLSCSTSHSSTYTVTESPEWNIHLDMEITALTFRYKRTIKDVFEFGLDVPLLLFGGGIADGFLEEYHDSFGFADYGRSSRPHNDFLYEVRRGGDLIIKGNSGTGFGDVRLAIKKSLLSSDKYTLSVKGDIEFPVTHAEEGYSNGSVDTALSLLFDRNFFDRMMTYWNVGAVFPGDVRAHEKVDLHNFIYGGLSVEAMLEKDLHVLVQIHGQSALYPHTAISAVDGQAILIAFGGRYEGDNESYELSLTEDLNTTGVPDFIVNFTYKLIL